MKRVMPLLIAAYVLLPCLTGMAEDSPLPDFLVRVSKASRFDGIATGYSAIKSTAYLSYEEAASHGKEARPYIEWLLRHASPAGRLYAAELLKRQDFTAGRKALENLSFDFSPVYYNFGGCVVNRGTVGHVASLLLKEDKSCLDPIAGRPNVIAPPQVFHAPEREHATHRAGLDSMPAF